MSIRNKMLIMDTDIKKCNAWRGQGHQHHHTDRGRRQTEERQQPREKMNKKVEFIGVAAVKEIVIR